MDLGQRDVLMEIFGRSRTLFKFRMCGPVECSRWPKSVNVDDHERSTDVH